jgi:ribonuclease-3
LQAALTHASGADHRLGSNERLEFLGDAILGFLTADHLFRLEPEIPEGELTDRRARIVSRDPLASVGATLRLTDYVEVGRGLREDERDNPRLRAELVEALLGAIYLDGGIRAARRFVRHHVLAQVGGAGADQAADRPRDPKSQLLHLAQARGLGQPVYAVVATAGPDHEREFTVEVRLGGRAVATGTARSKQGAEMVAADAALGLLRAGWGGEGGAERAASPDA